MPWLEVTNCDTIIFRERSLSEMELSMKKKFLNLFLAGAMALSLMAGCGDSKTTDTVGADKTQTAENVSEDKAAGTETQTEEENPAEDNEAAAQQLLVDLTGSYQELWPVILSDEYNQIWLDNCKELVGEDNAQAAYEKLASMVSGEIYGEEAVKAYADGNGVYDCHFTEDVTRLAFDGAASMIKGYDAQGNELFSHTYHYVGMEEIRGLYEYESDDADSGEFTYFCIAPDTSDTTYHIELRYGSDLDKLGQYDKGEYAYWLGSGISVDCDQTMIENCIKLFCEENLSQS